LIDDNSVTPISKLGEMQPTTTCRSPEERAKDLEDVLTWTRNKDDETKDPTSVFSKPDTMLPTRPGQKPEDRAVDIEHGLDWLRNNNVGLEDVDDEAPGPFDSVGSGHSPSRRGARSGIPETKNCDTQRDSKQVLRESSDQLFIISRIDLVVKS
jgi:hypothetical protein